jgi:hypothetical protein
VVARLLPKGEAVITVATWLWGDIFTAEYARKLKAMLKRNLRMSHRFVCIADSTWRTKGLDSDIELIYAPPEFHDAPNCIRRMKMYEPSFAWSLGKHVLLLDLDIVITKDITTMIEAPLNAGSSLALWKVGHPGGNRVYAGGVVLQRAGALDAMWKDFLADPLRFGTEALMHTYCLAVPAGWGMISDQAMLNFWMHHHPRPDLYAWTSEIQQYFPKTMYTVPDECKIITIGRPNLNVLQRGARTWVAEHWR